MTAIAPWARRRRLARTVIPGFGITVGFTLFYLLLIVLIPLAGLPARTLLIVRAPFVSSRSAPR